MLLPECSFVCPLPLLCCSFDSVFRSTVFSRLDTADAVGLSHISRTGSVVYLSVCRGDRLPMPLPKASGKYRFPSLYIAAVKTLRRRFRFALCGEPDIL